MIVNDRLRTLLLAVVALVVIAAIVMSLRGPSNAPSPTTPGIDALKAEQVARVQENSKTWPMVPNYLDHFDALAIASRATGTTSSLPVDDYWGLPEDEAGTFDLVGMYCGGCHSLDVVTQQRATRARWASLLAWMVEEQGMVELEPADERAILDYLVTNFGS